MESTGISPVGGLDNLISAAASSQSVNSALQEFTAAHIQVLNINEIKNTFCFKFGLISVRNKTAQVKSICFVGDFNHVISCYSSPFYLSTDIFPLNADSLYNI